MGPRLLHSIFRKEFAHPQQLLPHVFVALGRRGIRLLQNLKRVEQVWGGDGKVARSPEKV